MLRECSKKQDVYIGKLYAYHNQIVIVENTRAQFIYKVINIVPEHSQRWQYGST